MEEHREILAHRLEALLHHLFGRGADHHVVALFHRQAEQLVTNCAAHRIDFHFVA
jgi:hypothetical protein